MWMEVRFARVQRGIRPVVATSHGALGAGSRSAVQEILLLLAYTLVLGALGAVHYRRDAQREYA